MASTVESGWSLPTSVAMSRSGVSIGGLVGITPIFRSMPLAAASATTCLSAATSAPGALTPSAATAALTAFMSTSGGMYSGRKGMTSGPVTGARYRESRSTGSRHGSGQDWVPPWGGLQDKRTVKVISAGDTARHGDN